MRVEPLSRRSFLTLAGGAAALAGGAAALAACGSAKQSASSTKFTDETAGVVSSDLYVSQQPQRFAFAVLAKQGYASGKPARVALAPPGKKPTTYVSATPRAKGLPEFRGVYTVETRFTQPGFWRGSLEYDGHRSDFFFQVNDKPRAPHPGLQASRAPSPTPAHTLGVDPICTREPPCPLHTPSLDTIIGKGRPVAVIFATPARCQTQYCGPVLDALLPLVPKYQDRLDVVHVEIYMNLKSPDYTPTVKAWGIQSEPWLFGVDSTGKIASRLDGAFDQDEMHALLQHLVTT